MTSVVDARPLGARGEALAARALEARGFTIVAKNVRTRSAEIDLVVSDATGLVFVEVKTRATDRFGDPWRAVDVAKLAHMRRAALEYLARLEDADVDYRFGIVSIVMYSDGREPVVEWIDDVE